MGHLFFEIIGAMGPKTRSSCKKKEIEEKEKKQV